MTTQPNPLVEATIEGIKQGVDMMVPLVLELDEGDTDESVLTLAETDKAEMQFRKAVKDKDPLLTLSTETETIVIRPDTHTIELYFRSEATLALAVSKDEPIMLYGTLLVEDSNGDSRPCSGIDLACPVEPSYTR